MTKQGEKPEKMKGNDDNTFLWNQCCDAHNRWLATNPDPLIVARLVDCLEEAQAMLHIYYKPNPDGSTPTISRIDQTLKDYRKHSKEMTKCSWITWAKTNAPTQYKQYLKDTR